MGKKKSKTTAGLLSLIALGVGIVAFVMMFLDAVTLPLAFIEQIGGTSPFYKGTEVVFGLTQKGLFGTVTILNFNVIALVAFLLPLAGGVVGFLLKDKLFTVIAILCFVLGAIAMFAFSNIFVIGMENEIDAEFVELCAGPILAGICSIIGALCLAGKLYFSK